MEEASLVGRWAVVGLWPPDHSDLLLPVLSPTEISSVTAQAAEPRVSGWGSPGTLGMGPRRKVLPLVGVPGPLLKFDLDWSPSPTNVLPSQRQVSYSTSEYSQGLEGDELSVSGTEAHAGFMVHMWFGESWGSTSELDLGEGLKGRVQGVIEDLDIQ